MLGVLIGIPRIIQDVSCYAIVTDKSNSDSSPRKYVEPWMLSKSCSIQIYDQGLIDHYLGHVLAHMTPLHGSGPILPLTTMGDRGCGVCA